MPGMGGSGNASSLSDAITSAFHSALLHQWLVVLAVFAILIISWNVLRAFQLAKSASNRVAVVASSPRLQEPPARRLLRIGFGMLWLLDGLLQSQAAMPLGMADQVVKPTVTSSPHWVRSLVDFGANVWDHHPITTATAVFWIQIGIAVWLLSASRGRWSRLGGIACASWGAFVWVFGESFGGLFAPGYSWLFGAPGAAIIYSIAGILIALPNRTWSTSRLGLEVLRAIGAFMILLGVLQAWPGRGFWQGGSSSTSPNGTLSGMVASMSKTPQPGICASWARAFATFDVSHGFAVNLFIVIAMTTTGIALANTSVRDGKARTFFGHVPFAPFFIGFLLLSLADWVLVQDFGFFGGLGTDPNSMIPFALLASAGFTAAVVPAPIWQTEAAMPPRESRLSLNAIRAYIGDEPIQSLRSCIAGCAIFTTAFGAIPFAAASLNPLASPIIAQAIDGTPAATQRPAPPFTFTNQYEKTVSLADFRNKIVVLTFLDPVCTTDCPIIGQELRATDGLLGSKARQVEIIAVDANPLYRSNAYTLAYSNQEGLDGKANWEFLSGSLKSLAKTWSNYSVSVSYSAPGSMIAHNDIMYVIGRGGVIRYVLNADIGSGSGVVQSSFENTLLSAIRSAQAS